ncbi:MAG: succinyl-diaminopimelate desuccinylase, partial [Burkholderiaceae bacterium]|nr:succinyl-diaminopimelate desuccinylase [Burkholderiaceae bacterium]
MSFQISNVHAGTGANNIIPGELVIEFNFRFSTESTPEQLKAAVELILREANLQFSIDWTLGGEPFLTGDGELAGAMREAILAETEVQTELSTTG